jgi:acetyl esterase
MAGDEGVLDPWVVEWFAANPMLGEPRDKWTPDTLALARGDFPIAPGPPVAAVTDEVVAGVPVRVYEHDHPPTAVVAYFHGGGFCTGSIGLMDNVARELACCADVAVVSVEYRLAPEHPYPAGLDDCEAVTRALLDDPSRFGPAPIPVVVAGESAGGSLSTGVALRLRDRGDNRLAGQVLVYPGVAGGDTSHASRTEFEGVLLTAQACSGSGTRTAADATSIVSRTPSRCMRRASRACHRRSSCSAVAMCCATKVATTRTGSPRTVSTWKRSATRASRTAS